MVAVFSAKEGHIPRSMPQRIVGAHFLGSTMGTPHQRLSPCPQLPSMAPSHFHPQLACRGGLRWYDCISIPPFSDLYFVPASNFHSNISRTFPQHRLPPPPLPCVQQTSTMAPSAPASKARRDPYMAQLHPILRLISPHLLLPLVTWQRLTLSSAPSASIPSPSMN